MEEQLGKKYLKAPDPLKHPGKFPSQVQRLAMQPFKVIIQIQTLQYSTSLKPPMAAKNGKNMSFAKITNQGRLALDL